MSGGFACGHGRSQIGCLGSGELATLSAPDRPAHSAVGERSVLIRGERGAASGAPLFTRGSALSYLRQPPPEREPGVIDVAVRDIEVAVGGRVPVARGEASIEAGGECPELMQAGGPVGAQLPVTQEAELQGQPVGQVPVGGGVGGRDPHMVVQGVEGLEAGEHVLPLSLVDVPSHAELV
jgi:hypothetical protein